MINNIPNDVGGGLLRTSPSEFDIVSYIINYFDSEHAVILLRYSNDKSDAFVLSQFGVGWVATSYLKEQ